MWVDERVPDYFEPIMSDNSWVMDEFNIHFFGLSEELIQAISKLSIEYTLDNKYLIEQYRNEKGIVQYDDRKQ